MISFKYIYANYHKDNMKEEVSKVVYLSDKLIGNVIIFGNDGFNIKK